MLLVACGLVACEANVSVPTPKETVTAVKETVNDSKAVAENIVEKDTTAETTTTVDTAKLQSDEDFVVVDGQTWMKVDGQPVTVTVVTAAECGRYCDTQAPLAALKQFVSPALKVNTIDASTDEGQKLVADFGVKALPAYFANGSLRDAKMNGVNVMEAIAPMVTEVGDVFYFEPTKVAPQWRMTPRYYLETPQFADIENEPTKGDGPLQVVEYTAYQCGYCGKLQREVGPAIKELVEQGVITYALKDFPIGKPDIHVAANCAGEQGKYWEMHKELFDNQSAWSRSADPVAYATTAAEGLGLDMGAFETCTADGAQLAEVQADQAEGRGYGVTGTPSLFIGNLSVPGAIGADTFLDLVNKQS